MQDDLLEDLSWLPRAPADFAQRCQALIHASGSQGAQVRALASFALDEHQLHRLTRGIDALRATPDALAPLIPYRLGLISNATTHYLVAPLVATAARYGFALECVEADFDQSMQAALDPGSSIHRSQPDAVLIAVDERGLPLRASVGDARSADAAVDDAQAHLAMIRRGLAQHGGALCIVQNLARPVESIFGSMDPTLAGTRRQLIDQFNRRLAADLAGGQDLLLDVAALAENVGLANWHDPTLWNLGKIAFANRYLPLYAEYVCRLIAASRGKSRRCLVLDLDNTLWGGVIGDDGIDGIALGQGDATGEAFLDVQRTALALRERGIVLAVSSKNEDATAREPFRSHPEMRLREHHIAVFQANWNDKATNIEAIARSLSLGLESLVLLDDNPVERGLVRARLPEVAVPELPDDPALYARTLLAAGYFEATVFSAEDRRRAELYEENAKRVSLQESAADIDDYLRSLAMTIHFAPFDRTGRARIAQLINKSNQFNLTTKRYTEAQIARMQSDPSWFTWQIRLVDRFGDNGMISVVICRQSGLDWEIDTWLMSCRVLARKVEQAVLEEIVRCAKLNGVVRLQGIYRPTARNVLVKDHYQKLGFTLVDSEPDGTTRWQLMTDSYRGEILPITVAPADSPTAKEAGHEDPLE